jgi:hypothetical protein
MAHQLLLGGHVGVGHRKAGDQPGQVAVMMRHAQAADGESLRFPVDILLGQRPRLAEQPLRLGESPVPNVAPASTSPAAAQSWRAVLPASIAMDDTVSQPCEH